jgi:HlyD family secretion protein
MTTARWVFAALLVALVGLVAWSSLQRRPPPPTTVHTATVGRQDLTRIVSGAGRLEPARKVNVSSNITGTLLDLRVGIGSQVTKGDTLGQIDTSRYASVVEQQRAMLAAARSDANAAKARLARLRRDAERLDQLAGRGAVGAAEVEQAHAAVGEAEAGLEASENRVRQAQAALGEASHSLEWATLKAPVDGTVLAVHHRVGERVRGSEFTEDVVLVIGSIADMEVRIEVSEHDVVWVKPNQRATVELDALPDVRLTGHVLDSGRDAIVKFAGTDNEVTTFPVWVVLDEPPPVALSGMSAHVEITTDTRAGALAAPIQAVTLRAPQPDRAQTATGKPKLDKVVFVVKAGRAVERRKVQTGLASDTMIEITDGLHEGEEIVEGPYRVVSRQLEDGDAVDVDLPDARAPKP